MGQISQLNAVNETRESVKQPPIPIQVLFVVLPPGANETKQFVCLRSGRLEETDDLVQVELSTEEISVGETAPQKRVNDFAFRCSRNLRRIGRFSGSFILKRAISNRQESPHLGAKKSTHKRWRSKQSSMKANRKSLSTVSSAPLTPPEGA